MFGNAFAWPLKILTQVFLDDLMLLYENVYVKHGNSVYSSFVSRKMVV